MDNAIFETLMYVDPVSRGTARPIAFDTSERARLNIATVDDADAAVRLAYALAANGWHPHQHRTAVAKAEQESVGFIGPLTEECARALQRCQTLADDIAFRPPPTNPVPDHDVPWPRDSAGRYRLKWINDDRPSERTTTHTDDLDDEKRSIIWRTIVAEIASSWATASSVGKSAGRVFLGPRDRFIFWPRHLNDLLQHAPTGVGRIVDLFVVLAQAGVKLDVKSAYRALELCPDDAPYHAALVDSVWVIFTRLSFGMSQSPAIFAAAFGVTLANYAESMPATSRALSAHVDDAALAGTTVTEAVLAAEALLIAFRRDHWWASLAKAFLYPAARLLYVGFIIDFPRRTAMVAPSKAAKVIALLATVRRPTDETLAAAAAAAAPRRPATAAHRTALFASALARPGFHRLAMAPLVDTDATSPLNVVVIRGPQPVTLPSSLSVVRDIEASADASVRTALASELGRPDAGPPILCFCRPSAVPTALPPSSSVPVVFVLPAQPATPPRLWFHRDFDLPPHVGAGNRRPLPAATDIVLPRAVDDATVDLTPSDFATLTKVTGYYSWFQNALPFIAFCRAALSPLTQSGRWTADTAAAFDAVVALSHVLPSLEYRVDPPTNTLVIVTDASGTGWGATLHDADGHPIHLAGALPPDLPQAGSGAREAYASVAAITAAMDVGVPFDAVRVVVDATALVGAAGGHARAPDIVRALLPLTAWGAQGLRITFQWHARDALTHAGPDALSAAATTPRPWPLAHGPLTALWCAVGGWDVDVCCYGGHGHAAAAAYLTAAGAPLADDARRTVLQTLAADTRSVAPRQGWVGTIDSCRILPGEVCFAWPLWSDLRDIVAFHDRHRCALLVVCPTDAPAGSWWAPHLRQLIQRTSRTFPLCNPCTVPPVAGTDRDPTPLCARLLTGTAPIPQPPRHRPMPRWPPTPQQPAADHRSFRAPRGGTPADAAWMRGGRCPKDRPDPATDAGDDERAAKLRRLLHRRTPTTDASPARTPAPQRRPRVPPTAATASFDSRRPSGGLAAALRADPRVTAVRGPLELAPPQPPRTRPPPAPTRCQQPPPAAHRPAAPPAAAAPPEGVNRPRPVGLAAALRATPAPPAGPTPCTRQPAAATAPPASHLSLPPLPPPAGPAGYRRIARGAHATVVPIPPAPAGATVRQWCEEMLRVAALEPPSAIPDGVHPAHASAIASAARTVAQVANEGSDAQSRLPRLLRSFADHHGTLDHPWSLAQAEALVLHFCLDRHSAKPSLDMPRIKHARDVLGMASRIAACSTRAGFAVPPHCGPRVTAAFNAKGAGAKREHSAAYPVHLSSIMKCRPPADSPDRDTWEAWFMMSLFCLRTGIVYHLYSHMFLPHSDGYLLVWRFVQKRAPVPESEDAASSVGAVSAARHALLHDIIKRDGPNRRLFPDVTPARLNAFARAHFPHCPPGFDVRAYGARTGADAEANLLSVPDDIVRVLFWWKRANNDMRSYYGGVNVDLMFRFSERRLQTEFRHTLPGVWTGRVLARGLTRWDPAVGGALPDLPPYATVLETLRTRCPSLVVTRRVRAAVRANAARRALGLATATTPAAAQAPLTGTCVHCFDELGPDDGGLACEHCDEVICLDCVSDAEGDYFCPAHKKDAPKRAPKRKRSQR